jgi:hypothetical protein
MSEVTIVSCFYLIPENEKRGTHDYCYWLSIFLNYIRHPIVFFSDGAMADTIDSLKRIAHPNAPWKLIRRPLEKLAFQTPEWEEYWKRCCEKGTNGKVKSPNVYRIWANKLYLLDEVAKENPFNTKHFYWCDGACWRNEDLAKVAGPIWQLPLSPGFHCTWIKKRDEFNKPEEILLEGATGTIAGGIFGGTADTIPHIKEKFTLYYEAARRHNLIDLNDQGILAAAVWNEKDVYKWNSEDYPIYEGGDSWFLFQYLFLVAKLE